MALLDSTPPSPEIANRQPSMQGLLGGDSAPGATDVPGPDMGGILQLGQQLDESILLLAQALPAGAPELSQARELIKQALAKALAMAPQMGTPSSSPTEPGAQFPGSSVGKGAI